MRTLLRFHSVAPIALVLAACGDSTATDTGDDDTTGDADSTDSSPTTTSPTTSTTSPTTTTSTTDTETADTSTTDSTSTDDSTTTTDPDTSSSSTGPTPECAVSEDCTDPLLPICDDTGTCIACTAADDGDADCAALDPLVPACGADGSCVQCTETNAIACLDTTPICDTAASTCVGCTYHEQCAGEPQGACDIATGACFGDECVIEIDGTTTIAENLADGCILIIHALANDATYEENLVISGINVALLAAEGETPRLDGGPMNPAISIIEDANAYTQGLFVLGNARGVDAISANVWLDRMQVLDSIGGGVAVADTAIATIRNSVVAGGNDTIAIAVTDADIEVLYSTIIGNFGNAGSLVCTDFGIIDIRNSLLVTFGDDPEINCTTDSFENSLTEMDLGEPAANWFVNANGGDYHLTENVPMTVLTGGVWHVGDPLVDLDGDLRPTRRAAADVVGADVPQ